MTPSSKARSLLVAALVATAACSSPQLRSSSEMPGFLLPLARRELSSSDQRVLDDKSFVVSPIDHTSFHAGYAALFKAHSPVYFTADALLHALHASFDAILRDLESSVLTRDLAVLLSDMRVELAKSAANAEARASVDAYLAVAKSLLDDAPASPVAGADRAAIDAAFSGARRASGLGALKLGGGRTVDFSMFKPRGHYTKSEPLKRYFRAMMWLGTVDMQLAEQRDGKWSVSRGQLDEARLLGALLRPRSRAAWQRIERASAVFVGPPDSMSFPGLERASATLGLPARSLAEIPDEAIGEALRPHATQRIRGGVRGPGALPLTFAPLGQRFVFDSLVFTRTTYGSLPAKRMMPSPLDVAASVFHNPAAGALLAPELARYDYKPVLTALSQEGDRMGPELWEGSLYHGWLKALRALSPDPEKDAKLPAVFRSEPWQRRMLGSQLASWAELRHDTILYAKQSMTVMAMCEYPDGYVDPYPGFFAALSRMAELGKALVGGLDFTGAPGWMEKKIAAFWEHLGEVSSQMRGMAVRERANEPLTAAQVSFLNDAVKLRSRHAGCTTVFAPEGWYADLHYDRADIWKHEAVVADVHTQPTDEDGNTVGRVLHVGTSSPRLITVRIDTCKGPRLYRGLVSSYHELVTRNFERLTDGEWQARLSDQEAKRPEDPPWVRDFVAR